MNQLETLLNTLIQMGWKPFGKKYTHLNYDPKRKYRHIMFGGVDLAVFSYSLRQLVSLESGLWKFVCENKMCKNQTSVYRWYKKFRSKEEKACRGDHYEYRLLESALIPEEELGKFLIENIKTE